MRIYDGIQLKLLCGYNWESCGRDVPFTQQESGLDLRLWKRNEKDRDVGIVAVVMVSGEVIKCIECFGGYHRKGMKTSKQLREGERNHQYGVWLGRAWEMKPGTSEEHEGHSLHANI